MQYVTCTNIVTDSLHRDDGISYSTTLQVSDYTFDPTMHLQMESMTHATICEFCLKFTPSTFTAKFNIVYIYI